MVLNKQTLEKMKSLPRYAIEIGVFELDTKRDPNAKSKITGKKPTTKATIDITNAQILFINEFGSPINHIPKRPVLRKTLLWAIKTDLIKKTTEKALFAWINSGFQQSEFEKELEKACIKLQNKARKMIYDNNGAFVDNAPYTIAKKGDNHPLFNTGQLARSITARVVKL